MSTVQSYVGTRVTHGEAHDLQVWIRYADGREAPLPCLRHRAKHFDCGTYDHWSAELALAISEHHLATDDGEVVVLPRGGRVNRSAWQVHQFVKWHMISKLPRDRDWEVTRAQLDEVITRGIQESYPV